MAENHRTPGSDVVDVTPPILSFEPRALRAGKKDRLTADSGKGPHRRIYTARDYVLGF